MELEKILFSRYNTGKLKYMTRLDFLEFLDLRNQKLLKSNNKKEIQEHLDMLEQMQDICKIQEMRGFLFALSLQLRQFFNLGINTDKAHFLASFKKSLEKEGLDEYINDIENLI